MIRVAALRRVGGYRTKYEWVEDKDLWLRLAEVGRLANLREPLLQYRLHEKSVCAERRAEQRRLWEQLLVETYARRGLQMPLRKLRLAGAEEPSAAACRAKWVRAAARGGNYRTAAKHAGRLAKEYPLRPSTWATLVRAGISLLKPRRAA
jgi:hypothetical protein